MTVGIRVMASIVYYNSGQPVVGVHMEFPKIRGTFWGPYNRGYSMLGSILGSPYFGKLPHGMLLV